MNLLLDRDQINSVWTVSELNHYIRELFEIDYRLQDVEVTGEVSNFTRARSGHLYFTLKDDRCQLKCVMWRSSAERLRFPLEDGDAVVVGGRISVYEAGGIYQLYADHIEPAGRGDLALAFERLKQKLAEEGFFELAAKQSIPAFPHKIGVVTSADAAALRDILNVLQRRCPLVSVLVAPTLVQGPEAPAQIVRALQWLDGRNDVDTIIIARGGGSMEDLWAFNDERVASAIFAARHPIISGVGHESDFTIADLVADLRAPTPSAAAELAAPNVEDIRPALNQLEAALSVAMRAIVEQKRGQTQTLTRALVHLSPRAALDNNRQRIDGLLARLDQGVQRRLERERGLLAVAQAGLTAVSPLATLSRGYAIVRQRQPTAARIIRSVEAVASGDKITIQVADGDFGATVEPEK